MNRLLSYLRNHYREINKGILFLTVLIALIAIFPKERKFKYDFQLGKPWMYKNLIAPFDFAILKSDEVLSEERERILDELHPYFTRNLDAIEEKRTALIDAFEKKWAVKYHPNSRTNSKKEFSLRISMDIFDDVYEQGIILVPPFFKDKPSSFPIMVLDNNVAEKKLLGDFYTIQTAYKYIRDQLDLYDNADKEILISIMENVLMENVLYDGETTQLEQETQLDKISLTYGMVQTGERIIAQGELITKDKYQILKSLKQEYENKLGGSYTFYGILTGQSILLLIAFLTLFFYLMIMQKDIFRQNKKVFLILLFFILMILATHFIVKIQPGYIYIIPICLIPILLRVFFDHRLALIVFFIALLISSYLVPNSFEFIFLQFFAGMTTLLSTFRLEKRSQFFITALLTLLTYVVVHMGLVLIENGTLENINYKYFIYFSINVLLSLFAYPLIYIIEKIFGMITDVTLLELSNTNNKVLRELALKAPGTFQHSMQVANLAEEAIHEIGGNPLLTRTGALYHDIGKINNPLYFIENQSTGINPHDELTFEESAEIIINHVIEGVEKAKQHRLPEQIIDFIRTHHGTRRVEYFYLMALKAFPDEELDSSTFQYPGPAPFSKETAILMMADSVEAASRSIQQPNEEKITQLVEGIISKLIQDKQFDNANITLKDISKTKKILIKKLLSSYHLRIEYPE